MAEAFGSRPAAVGRELTKLHEEVVRDDVRALAEHFAARNVPGEVVLGVGGAPEADAAVATEDLEDEIRRRRAAGETVRDLSDAIALARGVPRRTVYRLALELERTPR
jgi:16S rRNA (cytidine1402-2'-O)-methyltransferase